MSGFDEITKAQHYNSHPSGVEAIDLIEHLPFSLGSAIKYLWRQNLKGAQVKDLKKALYYVRRYAAGCNKEYGDTYGYGIPQETMVLFHKAMRLSTAQPELQGLLAFAVSNPRPLAVLEQVANDIEKAIADAEDPCP